VGTKYPKWLLDLAKKLDTPEMRDLYRSQKISNPGLDESVEQMSEQIDQLFEHGVDSEKGDNDATEK